MATYARVSTWKFKPGRMAEAIKATEQPLASAARATKGFRGRIALQATYDPDSALFITLWEGGGALEGSAQRIFREVTRTLARFVERPPEKRNYRVVAAEVALTYGRG